MHRRRAVVFLQHGRVYSMEQLAAVVRRHGTDTVLVTTFRTDWLGRLADRFLYSKRIYLPDSAGLAELPSLLESVDIVDLQATEYMADAIADSTLERLPADVAARMRLRRRFSDKVEAYRAAVECGVRAPEQIPVLAESIHDVVEKLGLPIVVKTRLGLSGEGVAIAGSLAEAEQAVKTFGASDDVFYERFIDGPTASYSAIIGTDGIVQELTYRSVESALASSVAPPLAYEVIEDPDLAEMGRSFTAHTGLQGPMNFQTQQDADGKHWFIDLNPRPFGPMLAFDQNVIDTAAGYLYATGLADSPPRHRSPAPGLLVYPFPDDAMDLAKTGHPAAGALRYVQRAWSLRNVLGVKYQVFLLLGRISKLLEKISNRSN